MTLDEIRQRISDDFAAIAERHKAEKLALQQSHAQLWADYNDKKKRDGIAKVVGHNSAVAQAAAAGREDREARKALDAAQKTFKKIRARYTLEALTVDDAIEELESRIIENQRHITGSKNDKVLTAIQKMRQAIIELGGTPTPDPQLNGGAPVVDVPTPDEMDRLLNQQQ